MKHKTAWLLTIFIPVAVLASMEVPVFRKAMNRSRQKRTMADMRTIAIAWEARATDVNSYDASARVSAAETPADFKKLHRISAAVLQRELVPTYARTLPLKDAWGYDFEFRTGDYRKNGAQLYALRSRGRDGRPDPHPYTNRTAKRFEDDLVFANGTFIQYPEGV